MTEKLIITLTVGLGKEPVVSRKRKLCFYREVNAVGDRLGKSLIGLGIKKGWHVPVWAINVPSGSFPRLQRAKSGPSR